MVTLIAVNLRLDDSGLLPFLDVVNLLALRAVVGLLALRAVYGLLTFLAVVILVFFGTSATTTAFTYAVISVHGITLGDVLHGKSIAR